jgi:hypothetical protein
MEGGYTLPCWRIKVSLKSKQDKLLTGQPSRQHKKQDLQTNAGSKEQAEIKRGEPLPAHPISYSDK